MYYMNTGTEIKVQWSLDNPTLLVKWKLLSDCETVGLLNLTF